MRRCGVLFYALALVFPSAVSHAEKPDGLVKQIKDYSPSIVQIVIRLDNASDANLATWPAQVPRPGDGTIIAGTGFLVNDQGDIVTAAHVAEAVVEWGRLLSAAKIPSVTDIGVVQQPIVTDAFQSVGWNFIPIKKFLVSYDKDLAVTRPLENLAQETIGTYFGPSNHLMSQAMQPSPLPLDTKGVDSGEEVFAVGYPNFSPVPVTVRGLVATPLSTAYDDFTFKHGLKNLQTIALDIRIDHGNSGGPIVRESDGMVIGIVHSIGLTQGYLTQIIPARQIRQYLDSQKIPWARAWNPPKKLNLPPPPGRGASSATRRRGD